MHILASSAHRSLSAFRTLVFLCVIHHLANSYVHSYPTKSGLGEDRDRIDRLRMIAKRLTQHRRHPLVDDQTLTSETLAFIKSLTQSIGTAQSTIDKREETSDRNEIMNPYRKQTRLEVLKRVYRQASGPLANFKNTYTDLYNSLFQFLDLFIQHLIPGANEVLLNAGLIPSVLRPNDPSFSDGNLSDLMKKFSVVEQVLQALLDKGQEYVEDGYKPSFTSQARIIDNKLGTAVFATFSLPFHEDSSDVSLVACGIGCINTGVKAGMNYNTLVKLYSLINFLITKVVQTPT